MKTIVISPSTRCTTNKHSFFVIDTDVWVVTASDVWDVSRPNFPSLVDQRTVDHPDVLVERASLSGTVGAKGALEGFLSGVSPHVGCEGGHLTGLVGAVWAGEGSLPSVRSYVDLQLGAGVKMSLAYGTDSKYWSALPLPLEDNRKRHVTSIESASGSYLTTTAKEAHLTSHSLSTNTCIS